MTSTLPHRPRNRLAETILRALHDPLARDRLVTLASVEAARRWLPEDEARWAPGVAERAGAAAAALAEQPLLAGTGDLRDALAAAAVLFDARLYFEVHEVLEPAWAAAAGQTREALQGLIQVAVGWQHLASGNAAGARALLAEGGARLHGARLAGLDVEGFGRAAIAAAASIAAGEPVSAPPFPRA